MGARLSSLTTSLSHLVTSLTPYAVALPSPPASVAPSLPRVPVPSVQPVLSAVHDAETELLAHLTKYPYEKRLIPLPSGDYLNTLSAGDRSLPTLVVLHGWGAGSAFFGRNLQGLATHFRVHLVDWPGFGASSRPPFPCQQSPSMAERFFIDALSDWVDVMQSMDSSFPSRFHLLGHSLGAFLVAAFALRHPTRVRSLILASPAGVPPRASPRLPTGWFRRQWVRVLLHAWDYGITPQMLLRISGPFGRMFATRMLAPRFVGIPMEMLNALGGYFHAAAIAPPSGEKSLTAILTPGAFAKLPLCDRLHEVKVPTWFMYGDRDWMPVQAGREVCERITSVPTEVCVVENAGHHLYFDNAQRFNEVVVDACQRAVNWEVDQKSVSDVRQVQVVH